MKILVTGLPYFARRVASQLSAFDPQNTYPHINTEVSFWNKLQFVFHLLTAQRVYLIGGHLYPGRVLRLALGLKKGIIMHWVGTDILNAAIAKQTGRFDPRLLLRAIHLCEAPWIQEELATLGIHAEIAAIAAFPDAFEAPAPLPKTFSILGYVGAGREEYYGLDRLVGLARALPDVPVRIAGIAQVARPLPANIELLGWVEDMAHEYRNCTIYLRLPAHDGLAFSVLEAMAQGRHVGYTCPLPGTTLIETDQGLVEWVTAMRTAHAQGFLGINARGFEGVRGLHRMGRVMPILRRWLTAPHPHRVEP